MLDLYIKCCKYFIKCGVCTAEEYFAQTPYKTVPQEYYNA